MFTWIAQWAGSGANEPKANSTTPNPLGERSEMADVGRGPFLDGFGSRATGQ